MEYLGVCRVIQAEQPCHQLAVDNLTRPGLIDLKDEITMAKASRKLGRASVRQAGT